MSDLKKSLKLVANLDQHNSALIIHQNQSVLSIFRGAVRHEQSEKNCLLTTHTSIVLANSIDDKKTRCSTHHHDLPALLHALFVILNFLCVWSEVNPEQSKG